MGKNNLKESLLLLVAITGLAIGAVSCRTNPTKPSGPTFSMVSPFQYVTIGGTVPGTGNGQFNDPTDVVVDSNGNIYVNDRANSRIQKFSSNGTFLTKWNVSGSPNGLAVDNNGYVYVPGLSTSAVYKYNGNSNSVTLVTSWGSPGSGNGQFDSPNGIAVDKNGYVYVSESTAIGTGVGQRVQKFDSNGNFILKWGTPGSGNGQFVNPSQVAVDADNNVYVVDYINTRVQKFDSSGNYLSQFEDSNLFPHLSMVGVAVDGNGDVYLSNQTTNQIFKYDSNWNLVTSWGGTGAGLGQYSDPWFLHADANNNIWVGDQLNNRVQETLFPYSIPNVDTFGIFPNPTHGGQQAGFEIGLNPGSAFSISIKDSLGTVVNQYQGQTTTNPCILQWNMTSSNGSLIDPGTYFVIFQSGSIQKTQQLTYVR